MYYFKYDTKIGEIHFEADDEHLLYIGYSKQNDFEFFESEIIKEAYKQIVEYLDNKRVNFDLPLVFSGTKFQEGIYKAMAEVPYGRVISYKDLAQQAGSPKAFRAAGTACNKNPYSIVWPCHRIVGSDNSLVGYGGGLHIKEALLKLEGFKLENNKIK